MSCIFMCGIFSQPQLTTYVVSPRCRSISQSINHKFLEWPKYLKTLSVHYRQCVDAQRYQISRISAYDSVNMNVLSRGRKVARDGARVTSGGRQFYTIMKACNRKCSAANSGTVDWRLDESRRCRKSVHRHEPVFQADFYGKLHLVCFGLNIELQDLSL